MAGSRDITPLHTLQEPRGPQSPTLEATAVTATGAWAHECCAAEGNEAPSLPLLSNCTVWVGPHSLYLPSFSPWCFHAPSEAGKKKKSIPYQCLPLAEPPRKQLARTSVRCGLQAPSHPAIQRRFQNARSQMTNSQPRGFKGKINNWLVNIIIFWVGLSIWHILWVWCTAINIFYIHIFNSQWPLRIKSELLVAKRFDSFPTVKKTLMIMIFHWLFWHFQSLS